MHSEPALKPEWELYLKGLCEDFQCMKIPSSHVQYLQFHPEKTKTGGPGDPVLNNSHYQEKKENKTWSSHAAAIGYVLNISHWEQTWALDEWHL